MQKKFFRHDYARLFIAICAVWIGVLLVPYAVVGETWGMVWYLMTWPVSEWFKDYWEDVGVTFYVGLVTAVHTCIVFIILNSVNWVFGSKQQTPEDDQRDDSSAGGMMRAG